MTDILELANAKPRPQQLTIAMAHSDLVDPVAEFVRAVPYRLRHIGFSDAGEGFVKLTVELLHYEPTLDDLLPGLCCRFAQLTGDDRVLVQRDMAIMENPDA